VANGDHLSAVTNDTDYILGLAKMEGSVKILLEIERVLGSEDVTVISEAA